MVVTFQIPEPDNAGANTHYAKRRPALDWFLSARNPRFADLDRAHIGLAGHSAGGVAVSQLGQEDPRVSALVSWTARSRRRCPRPPDAHARAVPGRD